MIVNKCITNPFVDQYVQVSYHCRADTIAHQCTYRLFLIYVCLSEKVIFERLCCFCIYRRSWKQCLSGEPVSERNERQARCWARILLKRAMEKLPNKEGQKCPELNEHTSIAQQLWQDYSDVLRISLKKLKRVTFYPYDCHELL